MSKNIKGQVKEELTCKFWLTLSISILLYIITLANVYRIGGYSFGLKDFDLTATDKFMTELIGGLTLIFTIASIWIFYRTLKTQQSEIQNGQLRFETQQFENVFFQMLDRFLENRNQIKVSVEVYPRKNIFYEGAKYFDYTVFILRYLQLALKDKKIFLSKDWEEYEWFKSNIEECIDDFYLREKNPEEYEKLIQQEKKDERVLFASYKFRLSEQDWIGVDKTEEWCCKYAFKKVFSKYHIHHETYFRSIENLLEFIDMKCSSLNQNGNQLLVHYSKIISSNISQNELVTIFYYAVLFDKFKILCVKHNFFEKLNSNYLFDKSHAELISGIIIKNTQEHYDAQKTAIL